jgi:hypothetical protein
MILKPDKPMGKRTTPDRFRSVANRYFKDSPEYTRVMRECDGGQEECELEEVGSVPGVYMLLDTRADVTLAWTDSSSSGLDMAQHQTREAAMAREAMRLGQLGAFQIQQTQNQLEFYMRRDREHLDMIERLNRQIIELHARIGEQVVESASSGNEIVELIKYGVESFLSKEFSKELVDRLNRLSLTDEQKQMVAQIIQSPQFNMPPSLGGSSVQ